MPDNPHTHPEGSFVLAAEHQVDILTKAANEALRQSNRNKIWNRVLTVACVLLLVVSAGLGYSLKQQFDSAVTACHSGNEFKANETRIWAFFIALALKGNPKPEAHREARELLTYIESVDAPRNCSTAYRLLGSPDSNP